MPTVIILDTGHIAVTLSPSEQALSQMLYADKGERALDEVFNVWFQRAVESIMTRRFAELPPQDAADILAKLAGPKG